MQDLAILGTQILKCSWGECPGPPNDSVRKWNHVGHQVKFGPGYPNVPGKPCVLCSVCWFLAFLNINCSLFCASKIFRACFCSAKLCAKMCSDKKFLKLRMVTRVTSKYERTLYETLFWNVNFALVESIRRFLNSTTILGRDVSEANIGIWYKVSSSICSVFSAILQHFRQIEWRWLK